MATDCMPAITNGANGDIPSITGIRIRPPRIHHTNPYAAPHARPETYPRTQPPTTNPNNPLMTALLNK